MDMNTETIKLLALTRVETHILKSLKTSSENVSSLARITKIPRTSLYTALSSLSKRGLIEMVTKGKSRVVFLKYNPLVEILNSEQHKSFTYIYGKGPMLQELKEIYTKPKTRVYAVQPTKVLETLLHKFNASTFIPINELIKENKVVVESIVKVDSLDMYLQKYKGDKETQEQILKSFYGRLNSSTFIGKEFFNCDAELVFNDTYLYICNWSKEVGIKVFDTNILALIKELFDLAKGYGKKDDLNKIVREKINNLLVQNTQY